MTDTKIQELIEFKDNFYKAVRENNPDKDGNDKSVYQTTLTDEIKKMSKEDLKTKILEIESVLKDAKPPNTEVEPPLNLLQQFKNKFTMSPSVTATPNKANNGLNGLANFLEILKKEAEKGIKVEETGGRRKPRKSKRTRKSKRNRKSKRSRKY